MNDSRLIRTLAAIMEAPVEPPGELRQNLWERLEREINAPIALLAEPVSGRMVGGSRHLPVEGHNRWRDRRPTGVWAAVAMFWLVVAIGVALWWIRPGEPAVEVGESPTSPTQVSEEPGLAQEITAGTWSRAETALDRDELLPRVFVIDHRVLVIHEQNQGRTVTGEIYDPVENHAREIAASGLTWRANAAMVWTGTELLIVGGSNGPGIDQIGAAYDPATDTWRALADPPGEIDAWDNSITGPAVWTGTEMLIPVHGLAFNPVLDRWRDFSPQPGPRRTSPVAAWNGTEFIVWGGCDSAIPQCDDFEEGLLTDGFAYNPDSDTWRPLAPSPLAPGVHPTAEWTRNGLLIYAGTGDPDDGATFARYDPYRDRWQELTDPPLVPRRYAASAYDDQAFVLWGGSADPEREFGDGAVYDDEADTWKPLPAPPNGAARDRHAMEWVAGRLYITGGFRTLGPLLYVPDGEPERADPPVSSVESIPLEEPVPFRVFAVGTSGGRATVIDLFERQVVTYDSGLPVDRTDGAVAAPDGAWITWNEGRAYFFADGPEEVTAELGPNEVRSIEGHAPALRAIPDPGGERVWLVQPGRGYADHDEPTLVQLVSIDGGPPILDVEIDPNAFPVAATASGLVLNTHGWFDTGDGYVTAAGTERVLHLRADGSMETVGSGFAIAAGPDRIARLDCPAEGESCDPFADTNRLLITDPDGANPVEVEGPFEGVWRSVGGPAIPSDAMPLQATSPSGLEMLVSISRTVDINATPIDPTLVAVNLDNGTSRPIADIRPGVAAWSSDGRWVVVIFGRDLTLIASDDPDRMIELPGVIPENFWPLAAG